MFKFTDGIGGGPGELPSDISAILPPFFALLQIWPMWTDAHFRNHHTHENQDMWDLTEP